MKKCIILLFVLLNSSIIAAVTERIVSNELYQRVQDLSGVISKKSKERSLYLGYVADPNTVFNHAKTVNGKEIYNVNYIYNVFGQRVVERKLKTAPDKFVLAFGGSNFFGEGLRQDKNIPFLLQKKLSDYQVYNLAFRGYGPNHLFTQVHETIQWNQEIQQKEGIGIYLFYEFHMLRLIGSSSTLNYNLGFVPYLEYGNDEIVRYKGLLKDNRHFTNLLYMFVEKFPLTKYFNIHFPIRITENHFKFLCKTFEQSVYKISTKKKLKAFHIFNMNKNIFKLSKGIDDCFKNHQYIKVHNIYSMDLYSTNEFIFEGDWHLNEKGASKLANEMLKLLEL